MANLETLSSTAKHTDMPQDLPPAYTHDHTLPASTSDAAHLLAPPQTHTSTEPTSTTAASETRPSLSTNSSTSAIRDFAPTTYPVRHTAPTDSDAASLLPAYSTPSATHARALVGGFRSESAYLSALRNWAQEKQYMEPLQDGTGKVVGLTGFYGNMTSEDYIQRERARRSETRKMPKKGLDGKGDRHSSTPGGSKPAGRRPGWVFGGGDASARTGPNANANPFGAAVEDEDSEDLSDDELYRGGDQGPTSPQVSGEAQVSGESQTQGSAYSRRKSSLVGWIKRRRGNSITV